MHGHDEIVAGGQGRSASSVRDAAWILLLAIIGGAIAWGANLEKITEHSRRLKINEKTIKKLSEGRARIDERTKAILRSQSNTEQNIRAILRQLQSGRRLVR